MKIAARLLICVGMFAATLALLGYLASRNIYLSALSAPLQDSLAAVFFMPSITTQKLLDAYKSASTTGKKVRILLVPGHEPGSGGTAYKNVFERDLNLTLAHDLAEQLASDGRFEVTLARDEQGWNSSIADFFNNHWSDILAYRATQETEMSRLISEGKVVKINDGVGHLKAQDDVGNRLFGITMWGDQNGYDLQIHIHFNDYAGRSSNKFGKYSGFAIYVPDSQYSNALATRDLAGKVFAQLAQRFAVSNLPKEDAGVVGDQDLIAIGANNSIDAASMLIEYAYIYEPLVANPYPRKAALEQMASSTAAGIENYFNGR